MNTPGNSNGQYSLPLDKFRGTAGGQESCLDVRVGVGRTDALCPALSNTEDSLYGGYWNKFRPVGLSLHWRR